VDPPGIRSYRGTLPPGDAGAPPARRYFQHAIAPGTELATTVRLEMTGTIRLRPGAPWLPLRARQILSPHRGFVWRATVGRGLRTFVGGDQYADGRGAVRFWLWGALPVVRAGGGSTARHVARSAIGRMAAEAVWAPAALLPSRGVCWTSRSDELAIAAFDIDGEPVEMALYPRRGLRGRVARSVTGRQEFPLKFRLPPRTRGSAHR
jgi:hypothetical protein